TRFPDFRRVSQQNFPRCRFSVTPECLWRSNPDPVRRPATNGKSHRARRNIEAVSHMALPRACRAKEIASRFRRQPQDSPFTCGGEAASHTAHVLLAITSPRLARRTLAVDSYLLRLSPAIPGPEIASRRRMTLYL